MVVSLNLSSVDFIRVEGSTAEAAAFAAQGGMVLGAQFLAPARHRFQSVAQPIALDQGQAQGDDGGERQNRGRGGRQE